MHRCRDAVRTSLRLGAIGMGVLALAAMLVSSGCGSGKTPDEAKKELEKLNKKEKPKPPFDQLKVFTEPCDRDALSIARGIKPGHWTSVLVETKANHSDFSGALNSTAVDATANPLDLDGSPFHLLTSRSAALPKGQKKSLETVFFASRGRTSTWVSNQFRNREGQEAVRGMDPLPHMPDYQYYMFVLARDPNRYRYLKVLDCIKPPGDSLNFNVAGDEANYYRIVMPRASAPLALPTRSLCWTSIAFVVWDDVLPSVLSTQQQQAMLDWLHWGGGLILSGPQTLDALRGSFLEPYLPASTAETTTIEQDALGELNRYWTIPEAGEPRPLRAVEPWSGCKLIKHPQAEFLPGTGQLVVERRVGRGRVVATAFRLTERELIQWRSFDSFVNGGLLRRQPRVYRGEHDFEHLGAGIETNDPALVSNLRFFTRDTLAPILVARPASPPNVPAPDEAEPVDRRHESELALSRKTNSGVAAWDDFNPVSTAARKALREAAGISVPKRDFVVWMIGIYLLVVVPLNWGVFRLLGRVEWAWIAVPIVAIGWGMAVIWLAQLDIGFARSETEIAVLEMHGGFARGHLTRYMALYSSLSTSYDVHFDDPSAVAQPFAADVGRLRGQASDTVALRSFGDSQLDDYKVPSNSTGMVHSEQMVPLGGSLHWQLTPDGVPTIENGTQFKFSGVALIRHSFEGSELLAESCWIGELMPGSQKVVHFTLHTQESDTIATAWESFPLASKIRPEGGLSLRLLLDIAAQYQTLAVDEVRMVGWREEPLGGVHVVPAASQVRKAMLVVAHLQFGNPAARPDQNLRANRQPIDESPGVNPNSEP